MVLFKGPAIFGNNVCELLHCVATNEIIARTQQEPAGWFISGLLDIGLTKFHIGMFCLIGNCFCVAAYLSLQAPLLLKYPASLSMTAHSQFFGTMLMVIAGISATDGNTVWTLTQSELLAVLYAVSTSNYIFLLPPLLFNRPVSINKCYKKIDWFPNWKSQMLL
ncbi:hypothetical protein MKW92_026998 [Papaver armeniacum]|nr:hypothetical protein MKW92_026998 [Papaver armeniacum]